MLDLRTPKGTIDYNPKEAKLYELLIKEIIGIFNLYGASALDTPMFELKNILTNKYGEESKLIFDLADQGGDICSLRYDLTVPFARYLAAKRIQKIKRYQIGKVFRRDQPVISKGRLREFIQCDFDIAGNYLRMTADAEVIKIAASVLKKLEIGYFKIKLNHRKLLSAIFLVSEIPNEIHNSVCSAIDKADKLEWKVIKQELLEKGLNEKQIINIEKYVSLKGSEDLIETLKKDEVYGIESGKEAIDDLEILLKYLEIFKVKENVEFDVSLARGLDYYTGIIFEAIICDRRDLGSVLGGGRYDNLVDSLIRGSGGNEFKVMCVGFSVGIARIHSLLIEKNTFMKRSIKDSETVVFVGVSGGQLLEERIKVLEELREAGISSETFYTKRNNFGEQVSYCKKKDIPFMVILGEQEIKNNFVQVSSGIEKSEKVNVKREELVKYLKQLCTT